MMPPPPGLLEQPLEPAPLAAEPHVLACELGHELVVLGGLGLRVGQAQVALDHVRLGLGGHVAPPRDVALEAGGGAAEAAEGAGGEGEDHAAAGQAPLHVLKERRIL